MSLTIRKSVYAINEAEKTALRDAFQAMYDQKLAPDQDLFNVYPNRYQELASILMNFGHYQRNDLLFLPWARSYFWWFEKALQSVVPGVALPYWNYTSEQAIEEGLPNLFTEPTYTNREGVVKPNPLLEGYYKYPFKTYREVSDSTKKLQAGADLLVPAMAQKDFVSFSLDVYKVDITGHMYVGGSIANTHSTTYDPLFWFTHCNLDHMWWQWQQLNGYEAPDAVLGAKMSPFVSQNGEKEVLTGANVMHTTDLGYTYDG